MDSSTPCRVVGVLLALFLLVIMPFQIVDERDAALILDFLVNTVDHAIMMDGKRSSESSRCRVGPVCACVCYDLYNLLGRSLTAFLFFQ
jgi:hypothetical protein